MKLIGLMLGLILCSKASADAYKVVHFEASDYRDYSLEEMKTLLGDNAPVMDQYRCSGHERDPFFSAARLNPLRNSLTIKTPKVEEYFTYQQGKLFDKEGHLITEPENEFVGKAYKALLRFETIPVAADLLRELEKSYFPLTIVLGQNSFNPTVPGGKFWSGMKMAQAQIFLSTLRMGPGGIFSDIGSGGQILWNPNKIIDSIEEDGVRRPLDMDVALAHEMYHAFDSIRGVLDTGFVQGDKYPFESVVEYRAVYFENLVRSSLGIKYRKFYGEPSAPEGQDPMQSPDLLDDEGKPIFIPSVCL